MDATKYYANVAATHGGERVAPPPRNSEPGIAAAWLRELPTRGRRLLDVGCAGLAFLTYLVAEYERVAGVDIAAQPNWSRFPEIETRVCNLDTGGLPFDDASFDDVSCLMVLEHVFDPFHAVAEIRRVLRADGRVVLAVPNLAGLKHRLDLALGRLPVTSSRPSFTEDAWDGYHLHNFTQKSLAWLLRRQGLEPVRWAASGGAQWLKRRRPSLFGQDLIVLARRAEPARGLALQL